MLEKTSWLYFDVMLSQKATDVPRRNIEIKARLSSLGGTREIARALTGVDPDVLQQRDTYFHCSHGRLKLREMPGRPAELIAYRREDFAGARPSDYQILELANAADAEAVLAGSLGIRTVVEKRRELHLYRGVRIHIDEVRELGNFLEFEAVLEPEDEDSIGYDKLKELQIHFGISVNDVLTESYVDMLEALAVG